MSLDFTEEGVNLVHLVRVGNKACGVRYYFVDDRFREIQPPELSDDMCAILQHIFAALLQRDRVDQPVTYKNQVVVYPSRVDLHPNELEEFRSALKHSERPQSDVDKRQLVAAIYIPQQL